MLKTHSCGELYVANSGQTVTLAGWVNRRRDHGGLIFIDLRDHEGLTQVVFDPERSKDIHALAGDLRSEYVIRVTGDVSKRPAGTENKGLSTGEIEVIASGLEILNTSKVPPFYINKEADVDEYLRLKYRYLDLRRPHMQDNIILRHKVIKYMRDFLTDRGFIEIETPILLKSTPEGARDYLVPSRLYPGRFYALPQSPQQLKQLLMVAGFEKYFQIARCFRDEDQRADRQPEFTQLDLEMSFVEEEDILNLMEEMFVGLVETLTPQYRINKPFPRLKYEEVMRRFGSDKPDMRFGMEFADFTDTFADTKFGVFKSVLAGGGHIKGICAPGCAGYSRKQQDGLIDFVRSYGAKGLVALAVGETADDVKSQVLKYLTGEQIKQMSQLLDAKAGDLILVVADNPKVVNNALSALRSEMARRLNLADSNELNFAFIVDFPLLDRIEEENRWDVMHHPFTAPVEEDVPLLDTDPGKVRARHYDFVCNGCELSSGSIRIHQPEMQKKLFGLLGYTEDEIQERFGHLIEAFEYGAPPHGGIAPGIDRFVMLLCGEETIREVIPFPKTQSATDPMTGSPSEVPGELLDDLHLEVVHEPGEDAPA
ncbi:aspartate--tRNA ligase [Chloroflexota bacterium]